MSSKECKVGVVVPTLNAGTTWSKWLSSLKCQAGVDFSAIVLDSCSDDDTAKLARQYGLDVHPIERTSFNHGGTRQLGVELLGPIDIVVFLTQDAILAKPDSLRNLINAFDDSRVGAAFGRQLPVPGSHPIAAHARLFNYGTQSYQTCEADIGHRGLKAAFISNSFAAYRKRALGEVGGFSSDTIMCEDVLAGARLLKNGWHIAYRADATVYHSHDYRVSEEFRRYFDIGVFYACEPWLISEFGTLSGEGMKFVLSELRYLAETRRSAIPSAMVRNVVKWFGFQAGRRVQFVPHSLKVACSMHKGFWRERA